MAKIEIFMIFIDFFAYQCVNIVFLYIFAGQYIL